MTLETAPIRKDPPTNKFGRKDDGLEGRRWKRDMNKRAAFINALKGRVCVDCGDSHDPRVLDFHHVRGEKLFSISTAYSQRGRYSEAQIRAEAEKCDVVCANCHRYRHIRQ